MKSAPRRPRPRPPPLVKTKPLLSLPKNFDCLVVAKCCAVVLLIGLQLQAFMNLDNNQDKLSTPTTTRSRYVSSFAHVGTSNDDDLNWIIRKQPPKKHNFTAAICALVVDAEYYLMEWIDYHLALGFDEIFLYDNSPQFDLQKWYQNTRRHPLYQKVKVTHLPGKGWVDDYEDYGGYVQNTAYTHCIINNGKRRKGSSPNVPILKLRGFSHHSPAPNNHTPQKHDFMALIDLDEFIVLKQYPTNHTQIKDVLVDYLVPFGGALTMNWQLYGTSNKSTYSPIPLLKRNSHRDLEMESVVKTIVQSADFQSVKNPHAVTVRQGTLIRTTLFQGALYSYANSASKSGATDTQSPSEVIVVHHYRYASFKEYTQKACIRGEVIGSIKGCNPKTGLLEVGDWPPHVQIRSGDVQDDRAWKFLTDHVPKYKIYDDPQWQDYF